jgi:hypothetical protein
LSLLLLLLLQELQEQGECFKRSRLQLEVHVVLGWAKYSYTTRIMGNFAQDRPQGVQSCTACFFPVQCACDTLPRITNSL